MTSGRKHRRSPHGTSSPFPMAPWTPLASQSNWQTFLPTWRRRPSISLSDIRLLAAKAGTITAVENTMSKACARRCRRLTLARRPWLRCLMSLPMWVISRICGTNLSRHSRLAAHPRQSVVFSPSTCVTDGDHRLRYQCPPRQDPTLSFTSEGSLAARYDFATSLHTPWRAPSVSKVPSHSRTNT